MGGDKSFKIPDSWLWTNSSEVCSSVRDGTHDTPKYIEKGIPLITSKNLNKGKIDFENTKHISLEDHIQISMRSAVEKGDVLFAMIGTIGNPVVVETEQEFSIKNVGLFKKNELVIIPKYLSHWLSSFPFEKILENRALIKGTTQKFIPLGNLRIFPIPLPPLNEQRRIVAKIEALKARSQRVKDALEDIPQLLDQFRQSVLAAAFRGDLTADWREKAEVDFNKEWKNLTLKVLLSEPLANGRSVPDANEGFPVLRLTCLKNGHIDLNERKIGAWNKKEAENFLVHKYDFFVSRGNGSLSLVGRGGLVDCIPDEVAYPDTLIRIRVKHEICFPKFLSLVWNSFVIREQVEASARTTAGIHKINQKSMEQFVLPIPPIAEQDEILRCVSSLFTLADNIEKQYQQAKANIYQLDQSILAQAFRGELVPQDPNDEPASVLLESIRAERTNLETKIAKKSTTKISTRSTKNVQAQPEESLQLKLKLE